MFEDLEEEESTSRRASLRRRKRNYLFPYMELASERSGDGGIGLKEEDSAGDDDGHHKQEIIVEVKINILFLINIQLFMGHQF